MRGDKEKEAQLGIPSCLFTWQDSPSEVGMLVRNKNRLGWKRQSNKQAPNKWLRRAEHSLSAGGGSPVGTEEVGMNCV